MSEVIETVKMIETVKNLRRLAAAIKKSAKKSAPLPIEPRPLADELFKASRRLEAAAKALAELDQPPL